MSPFMLIFGFVATYIYIVEGQSCKTPSGEAGVCKSLYECDSLLTLVNKKEARTLQDTELLRKSHCGFEGNTPMVCCQIQPGVCKDSVSALPPDPQTDCCGLDSRVGNKIVGGNATTVDQYPWLAIIEYIKLGETKLLCGGVLISGRYVLTAGHCVKGDVLNYGTPKSVRLGEYDTENDGPDCAAVEANGMDCTDGMIKIPIETTIPHPQYKPADTNRWHDIALIRLQRLAPFTDFIRPICLPTVDLTAKPPVNFTMLAAGWGRVSRTQSRSNVKLQVGLPFVNARDCQSAYKSLQDDVEVWKGQVCAGAEQGKDSCKGDSGGPLMYENVRTYEVIGIVSYGPGDCGRKGIPGIYTKVFEYNNWIRSTIKP